LEFKYPVKTGLMADVLNDVVGGYMKFEHAAF
jgi:hypothetical protein